MAQVIDLAAARKERKPEPKNRVSLPRLGKKAQKRMQQAEAVRMAARLAI